MRKITLFIVLLLFTAFNYTAQAAESQTAVCTAGNLATVAASYLTTVTNLTVTGTIDAHDFKTMRDDMPLLEVIDLSGTTVAAYSGTGGTTESISYPANGVPDYAFCNPLTHSGKVSLKTFSYPASVKTIGGAAFFDCSGLIGTLTIPSTVTTIGGGAFQGCSGFSGSLSIPNSVTTIEDQSFHGCSGFTGTLTLSSSLITIGRSAFAFCSGFTGSLTIPALVTTIGKDAFLYCSGFTGDLTILSQITIINEATFSDCSGFTGSLSIPSTVNTIELAAFARCNSFSGTLSIPASVTSIGLAAFFNCSSYIEVDEANPNYSSTNGVLFNKDKTTLIQCPKSKVGSYIIPPSVSAIGYGSFYGCSGFKGSISIPSSVTIIGDEAFTLCSGFIEVDLVSLSYSSLDGVLFNKDKTKLIQCPISKIGNYIIPSFVTTIGGRAFDGCTGFTGFLTIPSSVLTIGYRAFSDCSNLSSINVYKTTPINLSNSYGVFYGVNTATCVLHVPVGSKSLYAAADQWKDFTNIIDDIVVTSIEDTREMNGVTIYPNPATSTVTVSELGSLNTGSSVSLSVVDVLGTTVLVKEVESNINSLSIDVSSLKKGIYFITFQTSNGRIVKRFVKE